VANARIRHLLLLLAASLAAPASAQQDPCLNDAMRLCPNVPAGGGDIVACLKAQEPALSPACRQKLLTPQQVAEEVVNECRADAARVCPGVQPGNGRIAACLKANMLNLSAPCIDALWAAKEKAGEVSQVCASDIATFCPGIPSGQGRIARCLKGNMAFLSPGCKALFTPPP